MPYYDSLPLFDKEFSKLAPEQRRAFMAAVRKIIDSLTAGQGFPSPPLVQKMSAYNLYEVRWAADGRATFEYAYDAALQAHKVLWRRIGDHKILTQP